MYDETISRMVEDRTGQYIVTKTGLRPNKSVLVLVFGLGLAGLVLCCETRSCHARRHNDLEGHSNFSGTIYSFSILCLEHHYSGDQ